MGKFIWLDMQKGIGAAGWCENENSKRYGERQRGGLYVLLQSQRLRCDDEAEDQNRELE